jgi:hypothetical protein
VAVPWESVLLPPYVALHPVKGYAALEQRLQYPRYLKALAHLHAVLERSPLAGHYALSGGLLLGWRREGRAVPWDCWDVDIEVDEGDLPLLSATLPVLKASGWRHRDSWAHNGGALAEVRFRRGAVALDVFVTSRVGDEVASWVFAERNGQWVQAEQRMPAAPLRRIDFLGLPWLVPDPVEPALSAMYGNWQVPDAGWDYMASTSIVDRQVWRRPAPPSPWA